MAKHCKFMEQLSPAITSPANCNFLLSTRTDFQVKAGIDDRTVEGEHSVGGGSSSLARHWLSLRPAVWRCCHRHAAGGQGAASFLPWQIPPCSGHPHASLTVFNFYFICVNIELEHTLCQKCISKSRGTSLRNVNNKHHYCKGSRFHPRVF